MFRIPLLSLCVSLWACGSESDKPVIPMPGEIARSELQRDLTPDVPSEDAAALVSGNTAFALDIYHSLRPGAEGENIFICPLSISSAMAMVYAGARGDTESQMAAAMHFDLAQNQLHTAFNWLDLELSSRGEGASGSDGGAFRLNIVNGTFGQTGYQFLDEFLDRLAVNYGAGLSLLDFMADPEGARQVINQWVADATEDNINELIPMGVIEPTTRLVLTNAVYFNAAWKQKFEVASTSPGTFHAPGGDVTVDMMNGQLDDVGYGQGDGFEIMSLPYEGDELDMVFIVPSAETFADLDAHLSVAALEGALGLLERGSLGITMPKFDFRFKAGLVDPMKELGMIDAFEGGAADFSGIDGTRNLVITDILHEAFVKVTEAGTEAGGATAVVVGETSAPPWVTIDRPFLFLIRDVETGTILFLGRVLDPA